MKHERSSIDCGAGTWGRIEIEDIVGVNGRGRKMEGKRDFKRKKGRRMKV